MYFARRHVRRIFVIKWPWLSLRPEDSEVLIKMRIEKDNWIKRVAKSVDFLSGSSMSEYVHLSLVKSWISDFCFFFFISRGDQVSFWGQIFAKTPKLLRELPIFFASSTCCWAPWKVTRNRHAWCAIFLSDAAEENAVGSVTLSKVNHAPRN